MFTQPNSRRPSVNVFVARAALVNEHPNLALADVASCGLPEAFPFLVDSDTQAVVEPVMHFLWERHLRQGSCVLNSAIAHTDDLRDWFQYLAHFKRELLDAQPEDIEHYRDLMLRLVSPKTHELYSPKTVARRVGSVVEFYRFAYARGWVGFDLGPTAQTRGQPQDTNMLAHVTAGSRISAKSLLPRQRGGEGDEVRAFSPRQYRALAKSLGPLPTDTPTSGVPVRDRLWAELCLHTGMRPDEPTRVTVLQVLSLQPEHPDMPTGVTFIQIRGKGNKTRKVELPNHLLSQLIWYIENERKAVLAEAKRRGRFSGRQEPTALFLNGVASRQNAGRPATYETFRSAFHTAVKHAAGEEPGAGLLRQVTKTDPDTQQAYLVAEPGFSPHCLRHTYAVWTYLGERAQGNAEPWKVLQARLGHKQMSTTMNTYLRIAGEFEATVSDKVVNHVGDMLKRGSD